MRGCAILTFEPLDEIPSYGGTIQVKPLWQNFCMVLNLVFEFAQWHLDVFGNLPLWRMLGIRELLRFKPVFNKNIFWSIFRLGNRNEFKCC